MPAAHFACSQEGGRRLNRERLWRVGAVAALLLGLALRTAQYFGRVSLWHDELAIARNIDERSFVDLVSRPLDHQQVAPIGFLAAVMAATGLLGVDELGLRLVPWILGLAALVLFWRVAVRFVSGGPLLAGLLLFAASPALAWYGASAKQYGGDLFVTLLLVWLALRFQEDPGRVGRSILAGVTGGAALLLSHPAVPTAFLLGCILLVERLKGRVRSSSLPLAALGGGWAIGALAATIAALRLLDPETKTHMLSFWEEDFPPPLSEGLDAFLWLPRRLFGVFAHFLLFIPPDSPILLLIVGLPAALALVGLPFLLARSPWRTALLVAPTAAAVLAAFAHLLPLDGRVALYAAWPILLLGMGGIQALREWLPGRTRILAAAMAVLVAAPLTAIVLLAARPPHRGQANREVIEELAHRQRPGDALYAFCGGRHAIAFYGPRSGIKEWSQGGCHYGDPRAYLREVDRFRGRSRVWFFYSMSHHDEARAVRSYLEAIGVERDRIPDPFGHKREQESAAYLYDLSDPTRLRAASAEDHDVPGPP